MKTTKHILTIMLVSLALFGCNQDWLNLSNPNRQTTETFWKTDADFEKGVNATYQSLASYDGSYFRFAPIALDLRGDDVWSPSPWDVLSNTGSFKLANNSIMQHWLWIAFYGVVNRANQVLYYIDDVEFADQSKKAQYKGEALFLRGLANFHLVCFFNKIPLVLRPYENEEDLFPSQVEATLVWEQIYADFDEASKLLPATYPSASTGRATKGAALAYLGKSYLFNKEWGKAATKFEEVMALNIYDLMPNYADNFGERFENNKESIFEVQYSREVGGTVLGWVSEPNSTWSLTTARAITYVMNPFGWGDVAPTKWAFDQFQLEKTVDDKADPRCRVTFFYKGDTLYGEAFDDVFATNINTIGAKKYSNYDAGRPDEKDWRSGINERLMRYADVYLMYAECKNELNDRVSCAEYIQRVRSRVNLPDRKTEFASLTQEKMREQIAHERLLEFVFEGHRFDDIRRWGWLSDANKLAELKQRDTEFLGYVPGREFFSIPQEEVEKNPNLKQSTGY